MLYFDPYVGHGIRGDARSATVAVTLPVLIGPFHVPLFWSYSTTTMATDTTQMLSDMQSDLQHMVTQFSEAHFVSIQGKHEPICAAIHGLLQHLLQERINLLFSNVH